MRGRRVVLFGLVERDAYGSRLLVMRSPQYEVARRSAKRRRGRRAHRPHRPGLREARPADGEAAATRAGAARRAGARRPPGPAAPGAARTAGRDRPGRGAAPRAPARRRRTTSPRSTRFRSPAHLRLILEELLLFQLGLARRRSGAAGRAQARRLRRSATPSREAVKRILPFPLTGAQKRVLREIADDLRSPHPMNRLLQGDVGSGKTVVALLAMVIVLENGYQAAFMAPDRDPGRAALPDRCGACCSAARTAWSC